MFPHIVAVCAASSHGFSKRPLDSIDLIAGQGVAGDAHCGETVRHLFDRRRNPSRPNLRQVHLVESELIDELRGIGIAIAPGEMGENILTKDLSLDSLSQGSLLHIGPGAVLSVTGLRQPCIKIDRFRNGLRAAVTADRQGGTQAMRRAVMAIVALGGTVAPGDRVRVVHPDGPYAPLALV
jgi:MOSC domain-containing protein YiiM